MPRCQAERNVPGTAGELGGDAKRRAVFQPRRVLRAAVLQLQRGVQSTPIAPGWPAVSLFDPPDKGGGERAFRERGVSDFDFSLIQIKSPAPRPSYIDLEPATAAAKRRKRRNSRPPVGIPDHGSLAAATPRIQLRPARRTPVTGKPRPRPRAGPFISAGALSESRPHSLSYFFEFPLAFSTGYFRTFFTIFASAASSRSTPSTCAIRSV
jgi:hypothetical protein